jgi:hypothetical protein
MMLVAGYLLFSGLGGGGAGTTIVDSVDIELDDTVRVEVIEIVDVEVLDDTVSIEVVGTTDVEVVDSSDVEMIPPTSDIEIKCE